MTARRSLEAIAFARQGGGGQTGNPDSSLGEAPGTLLRLLLLLPPTLSARAGTRRAPLQGEGVTFEDNPSLQPRAGAGSKAEKGATLPIPALLAPTPRFRRSPESPPQAGSTSGAQRAARPGPPPAFPLSLPTRRSRKGLGGLASQRQAPPRGKPGGAGDSTRAPRRPTHRAAWGLSPCPGPRTWAARRLRRGPSPAAVSPLESPPPAARADCPAPTSAEIGPRRSPPRGARVRSPRYPKQSNTHLGWDAALREASSPDPAGRRRLRPPPLRAPAGRAGLAPYVSRGDPLRASRRPAPPPLPAAPFPPRPLGPRAPYHPAGAAGARGRRPFSCHRLRTPSAGEGKEKYNLLIAYCASSSGLGDFLVQQPVQIEYSQMRKGGLACSHSFNKCLLSAYHVPDTVLGAWHIALNQRGGVLPWWNAQFRRRFEPSPA